MFARLPVPLLRNDDEKICGVIKDYSDWLKPKIVSNALELLDREIPKLKHKIRVVHLCFTTDPFMYQQKEVDKKTEKIFRGFNMNDYVNLYNIAQARLEI